MNLTHEQIGLLLSHLNTLFSEDNYDAQTFMRNIATDDLEELWELRGNLYDAQQEEKE